MRDLRRQALESGKTVSKKAKAKMASQSSSAANSRPASHTSSRNASRHGSDDEDADESDSTNWRYVVRTVFESLANHFQYELHRRPCGT